MKFFLQLSRQVDEAFKDTARGFDRRQPMSQLSARHTPGKRCNQSGKVSNAVNSSTALPIMRRICR